MYIVIFRVNFFSVFENNFTLKKSNAQMGSQLVTLLFKGWVWTISATMGIGASLTCWVSLGKSPDSCLSIKEISFLAFITKLWQKYIFLQGFDNPAASSHNDWPTPPGN